MFSNIRVLPAIFGGALAYPLIALILAFFGPQERFLLGCLIAGGIFTVISLVSGRALNYFYIPVYRDTEPGKYWFLTGNYLGFLLWSSLLLLANPLDTEFNYAEIINDEFTISSEDSQFIYELDKNATTLSGIATMTGFNRGIDEGGVLLTLHLLSHESGQKFDETYGKSGHCPAPFFNQNAKRKFLLASSKQIEEKILSWDIPDYRMSDAWEDFTITGRCIKRLVSGKQGEVILSLPDSSYRDCRFIVVNQLAFEPRS